MEDEVFRRKILLSTPYPEDVFFSTFVVLLKHGYNVNSLDSNGRTCLDYAVEFNQSPKVQEFLRSHGVSTAQELRVKGETAEIMKINEKLSTENKALLNTIKILVTDLKCFDPVLIGLSSDSPHSSRSCASPPSQMSEIELEDGISLNRPDILRMAAHWSTIAACLDIELPIIDIIKHDYPSQAEQACHEMLRRWCVGDELTGKQPRTLDTVLTAMKACRLEEYAEQVQKRH